MKIGSNVETVRRGCIKLALKYNNLQATTFVTIVL